MIDPGHFCSSSICYCLCEACQLLFIHSFFLQYSLGFLLASFKNTLADQSSSTPDVWEATFSWEERQEANIPRNQCIVIISCAKVCVKFAQSCPTLCDLTHPWNSPGQNTGVGSLSLRQGNLPNPGIEPRSPAWQDSLPAEPQGKPKNSW